MASEAIATPNWAFNNLVEVWDHRTFAVVSGGKKLDMLPESERMQSLNALATLVHRQAAALDDQWLSHVGMILVEDLFKTFVFGFNPSPGFFQYVAATGNAVLDELSRRGYTLHYVLDATQSADKLEMMLTYLPAFYHAAGFLATGPQLMALEILEQLEERRRDISGIPQVITEGLEVAEQLIKRYATTRSDRRSGSMSTGTMRHPDCHSTYPCRRLVHREQSSSFGTNRQSTVPRHSCICRPRSARTRLSGAPPNRSAPRRYPLLRHWHTPSRRRRGYWDSNRFGCLAAMSSKSSSE